MPVSYPAAFHGMNLPGPTTYRDDPGYELDILVAQLGELAMALQTKVGIGASTAALGQVLRGTGAGATAFGAIQSADIASGAVSQSDFKQGVAGTPTIVAASGWGDLPDMSITLTTSAGSAIRIWFGGTFHNSAVANVDVGFSVDGGGETGTQSFTEQTAGYYVPVAMVYRVTGLSAAAHTVKVRWKTGGGTATGVGTQRYFLVEEIKK